MPSMRRLQTKELGTLPKGWFSHLLEGLVMKIVCLDNWSIAAAWKSQYGEEPKFPLKPREQEAGEHTELDHAVARCFGRVTKDRLARADAAIRTIYPRMVLQPLPCAAATPAEKIDYLKTVVPKIVEEYAREDAIPKSQWRRTVAALKRWDMHDVDYWFLVWDAVGMTYRDTMELEDFYKFAGLMLQYTEHSGG